MSRRPAGGGGMGAPNLEALTCAVMRALIFTRDDETELEAFAAKVVSEGVVDVKLRGPESFTRRPCEGCEEGDWNEYCAPCMEAQEHGFDEPEYLTLRVTIEARL